MDGGGSMQSNDERGAEKLMDDYLKSIGLHRKKIAKDGSCLFRAVAEQVLHCQSLHTKVRAKCVEFLKQNREIYEAFVEGDFEDYLHKLQDPQQWVGEVEINALAVMYNWVQVGDKKRRGSSESDGDESSRRDFLIFQEPGKPAVHITDNNFKDKVQLCFLNGNHYDSVYPISHIKTAAVCQSIVYELLYDGVFKMDKAGFANLCQRPSRSHDLLTDDNMAACCSSDESDPDAGEALWVENGTSTTSTRPMRGRGRGRHLPERVRRSLNPTLFRNIDYDVWHKTKRAQQKMDYCIAAGMQFTAGDRCQVRLEGSRNYNAVIKEVPPNNGLLTVYIEELGARKQVPLLSLRPPSDENSWSTVASKRLSNGHGDWEERGKGRGRGKHVPASSSVSQATAPGPGGRVQKQHSWPMQSAVEEQGGAKASRKSVSAVESAFGLTEQQRLAKEEEERNVALVEIQLRDEQSFPALGTQTGMQSDGGKKKGAEKRRSQRNKTSPVEDVGASSPSAGERPKSSTPPLAAPAVPAATTSPPADSAHPVNSAHPAAPPSRSDSGPVSVTSPKASTPDVNMAGGDAAAATALSSASTHDTLTAKTSAPSSASAAVASPSPPPPPPPAAVPPSIPSSASMIPLLPPALPSASSPPTSHAISSSSPPPSSSSKLLSSSSPPLKSSASPPLSSSLPPPTFISPIAPPATAAAAQGFLPPSSLPRSSPPASSVRHSPSPPSSSSSSSSLIHQAAPVQKTPPVSAQNSLPNTQTASQTFQSQIHPQGSLPQTQGPVSVSQTSFPRDETEARPALPQNQLQTEAQCPLPESCPPQHQPQSHAAASSLPPVLQTSHPQPPSQAQQTSHPQPLSQAQLLPQSQSEGVQVQPSHPAAAPVTPQASVSVSASVPPQPSVLHPHVQLAQPPHPSQVPHPSPSLSASLTQPPPQPHTPEIQNQKEAALATAQAQQTHPPHPSHQPHPPPPHPQSISGAVPLQQLSQLYQDPLYPGFPQGEKGEVAPTPPMSASKSRDDLPKDINILRFFFNLGVKAYSMPMYAPYIYLLPLQHAHAMHPKLLSRSPSPSPSPTPHYPPSNPPVRHQEAYPHPQYPPTSSAVPPPYDHQAPLAEPPHPSEPPFNQGAYPITQPPPHRMPCPSLPWQQHQIPPPRNPSFPVGYPGPQYSVPPPLSQSYHAGQSQGHPMYPPSMPQYPPSSLGYQTPPAHEELQVSQGSMEQHQPANGDAAPGRVAGPAANVSVAISNRTAVVPGFALKNEPGESLTGAVLLVDPPLNNKPILVSNSGIKDVPASMTTIKTSSTPGSPLSYDIISKTTIPPDSNPPRGYRVPQKLLTPNNTYVPHGALEPNQMGYLSTVAMSEPLSVGCSTEDDWEEPGYKPPTSNYRGFRRGHRGGGGRGRGGYDPGRGVYRRKYGETGSSYMQYNASHRGRGRDKGY